MLVYSYVNHGSFSVEVFSLLLCYKCKYPEKIWLLRGNHESRRLTKAHTFKEECMRKYSDSKAWDIFCDVFDLLPLAGLINNQIFCVHGGLSSYCLMLDTINMIDRNKEVPDYGLMTDLIWSDPKEGFEGWTISPRGAGWNFDESITRDFMDTNGLTLIIRAHQLVPKGYRFMFNKKLVTIWSAPNHRGAGNIGAVMNVQSPKKIKMITIE